MRFGKSLGLATLVLVVSSGSPLSSPYFPAVAIAQSNSKKPLSRPIRMIEDNVREPSDRSDKGMALDSCVRSIFESSGRYERVLENYQNALAISRKAGDRSSEGVALACIGFAYRFLDQYERALENFQNALTIFREVGDRPSEGVALGCIGSVYYYLGQYEWARELYQNVPANHQNVLENHRNALENYQNALVISREIGDRVNEGRILVDIASIYRFLGEYERALENFQNALAISREIGDRTTEITIVGHISWIYHSLRQYEPKIQPEKN